MSGVDGELAKNSTTELRIRCFELGCPIPCGVTVAYAASRKQAWCFLMEGTRIEHFIRRVV